MRGVKLNGGGGRALAATVVAAAVVWMMGCGGGLPTGSLPLSGTTTPAVVGTPTAGGLPTGMPGQPASVGGGLGAAVPGPVPMGSGQPGTLTAGQPAPASATPATASASAASTPASAASTPASGYTVSGKVFTEDKTGVGGVTVSFSVVTGSGTAPAAVVTAADGTWAQSGFAPGSTYRVTPTRAVGTASWNFTPAYRSVTAAGGASFLERPRRIAFGTYQGKPIMWEVKTGYWGPGPNNWSDLPANVWIDAQGQLHLKITQVGGKWYCAEVTSEQSFGYNDYTFQLASRYDQLDTHVTAGLFTYLDDTDELDVELSRWGDPAAPDSQFVVQPYKLPNHLHRFNSGLTDLWTSQLISWRAGKVSFQSIQNHRPGTDLLDRLIDEWTYTGNDVPTPSTEKLHLNLWLNAAAPANPQALRELVVRSVEVG